MPAKAFLAGVVAFVSMAAVAQKQPPPATPPSFISEVTVNNVTVDVKVVDAHGVPVSDLKRTDFRIFEDDKEQKLTNFLTVTGGQVSHSRDASLVGQAAPRQVVVFFDLYQLIEPNKQAVVSSLEDEVGAGLPPAETMAIVSFDGTLRVHTAPTASRQKLIEALKEVSRLPATGLHHEITLSAFRTDDLRYRSRSQGSYEFRHTQNEEYWNEMRRIVGRVETAFSATLDRFTAAPGARKVVLLVSPGFPRADNVPVYRIYDFFRDTSPTEYRNPGLFDHAARLASELEYTLFALDPSGNPVQDADASAARPVTSFNDVANATFWREADRKDTLIHAARLTGGEAMFTADGGGALADVERLTASYYSLAFQPDHFGDGKEHVLKVEVEGHPDYQLTYRQSYIDRPAEQREAERTRAALLTGDTDNPLGIELVLDKPKSKFRFGAQGMHVYFIKAELRIPYANLTMLPRGPVAWAQVQVVVVATDPQGNQSDLTHQKLPIEVPADRLEEARRRGYFAYRFTVEMEGGAHSLRIGVDDVLAHQTSAIVADLKL
jgi:VWFA-related protein